MPALDERVRQILGDVQIAGLALKLPGQLDRDDYTRVAKVLAALGGKWNRRTQAHMFDDDPTAAVAALLAGGKVPAPARRAEGWVPTPAGAAADLCDLHTNIRDLPTDARVLEPSAGDGALVRVIRAAHPQALIVAVEPNTTRAARIRPSGDNGRTAVVVSTFEAYARDNREPFPISYRSRRTRERRSASARRHASIFLWSPESRISGTACPR